MQLFLVHPESPQAIVDQADLVGSTTAMIKAVENMSNEEFIVATDAGIFNKMKQLAPGKNPYRSTYPVVRELPVRPALIALGMGMNSLEKLAWVLENR